MKKLLTIMTFGLALVFCANILCAQTTNTTTTTETKVATPMLNVSTNTFMSMTNWFSKMATSMQISGVYTVTLNNHKPQGGGVATMWTFLDKDINANFHVNAGPVVVMSMQEQNLFMGAGATCNVIPNSKCEQKLNEWPVTRDIAKVVKWSDLYLFLSAGCQVDQKNPFIGLGGGIRCW